jgi:hypothetical protein
MQERDGEVRFSVPYLLPPMNRLLRMHWADRRRRLKGLAWDVHLAVGARGQPFARALVEVGRYSIRALDVDALPSTAKLLLDVLQPASKRHPYGLGMIADDGPDSCELVVRWCKVGRVAEERTEVVVRRL